MPIHEVVRINKKRTLRGGLRKTYLVREDPLNPGYDKALWTGGIALVRSVVAYVREKGIEVVEYELSPDDSDPIHRAMIAGNAINNNDLLNKHFRFID